MPLLELIIHVLILIIIIGILGIIPTALLYLTSRKKTKRYKEIKQKGTKTTGIIIGWSYGKIDSDFHHVYVSYTDLHGEQKVFKTPDLNFNPKYTLGSTDCTVYLYEDEVYVTDFKKAINTSVRVFKDVKPSSDDELLK